jgi:hypothetical protein
MAPSNAGGPLSLATLGTLPYIDPVLLNAMAQGMAATSNSQGGQGSYANFNMNMLNAMMSMANPHGLHVAPPPIPIASSPMIDLPSSSPSAVKSEPGVSPSPSSSLSPSPSSSSTNGAGSSGHNRDSNSNNGDDNEEHEGRMH